MELDCFRIHCCCAASVIPPSIEPAWIQLSNLRTMNSNGCATCVVPIILPNQHLLEKFKTFQRRAKVRSQLLRFLPCPIWVPGFLARANWSWKGHLSNWIRLPFRIPVFRMLQSGLRRMSRIISAKSVLKNKQLFYANTYLLFTQLAINRFLLELRFCYLLQPLIFSFNLYLYNYNYISWTWNRKSMERHCCWWKGTTLCGIWGWS